MRRGLCLVVSAVVMGGLWADDTIGTTPPGGGVTGTTQCKVGNVTQGDPAANGDIIVTFEVTRELSSEEKSFVSETSLCEHVTIVAGQEVPPTTPLVVNRGAGGTPTPNGGPVKISYTVTAKQGWDLKFKADMKYKDKNNTEQTLTDTKKYKVN